MRGKLDLGDRPVILCVSQKRTHKNLTSLVRAMVGLDALLVVPGSPTPHEEELRRLAAELGVAEQVRFPDWLADAELEGLYRVAACFVLPSLEEGFGLPVLEAMERGVPVCCSDRSSLPEVVGDAGLLFDPLDVDAIRVTLRRLLGDAELRTQLSERGRERAATFTWRRTAEATLDVYRRAIDSRRTLSFDRRSRQP